MRKTLYLGISMLLLVIAPELGVAQEAQLSPFQLSQFMGQNVFGLGHVNLGVVAGVNPEDGVIAIVGRHGAVAWISDSALLPDGPNLWAPGVTPGTIKLASDANLAHPPAVTPEVRVIEPVPG
ncbi:MAG TPA: hypothetical protein VFW28_13920 [Micropepsaceae bacterium]|nr:hypothetical protein [Micropepsaceae bacterium]